VIEIIKGLPRNVVGIAVKGRVTMRDCREILIPAMEKRLKRHDKIRLYYELGSRFPGAGWDDLDLGIERAVRCERVAIVTDIGWVRLTVKALRFLIPGEIRVFATIQVLEARAWIAARTSIETFAPVARSRRMRRVPPVRSQLPRDTEQTDAPNYVGRQQHAIQQILS
jgi:SpoIIAA-like